MKRRILALVLGGLMALSLCACGSTTENTAPEAGPTGAEEKQEAPKDKYYFADGVLVSEDVKIEITDYKVIPVGEEGNEYGEKPVVAFWYSVTNLTGNENVTPSGAWIAMFTAYQDTDPNQVNQIEVGMSPDSELLDSEWETVKKDGTAPGAIAYELDDLAVPVVLKATRGVGGETLGEQTFEIEGK